MLDDKTENRSYEVIGAAMEVHRVLGPGYTENLYEEALCIELVVRNVPFARQKIIDVNYKGQAIGQGRLDILVDDVVIVELKAVEDLHPIHTAQVISYLKMTGIRLGLLINFNVRLLKDGMKRIVLSPSSYPWCSSW